MRDSLVSLGRSFIRKTSITKLRPRALRKRYRRLLRRLSQSLLDRRARRHRASLGDTTVIGVTGSCGKTTTSRLIGALLSRLGEVAYYDNERTRAEIQDAILAVRPSARFFVCETATNQPEQYRRKSPS